MTDQTTAEGADPNCVRKVVAVQAPPDVAWRVFTQKMGIWWPLATYKIVRFASVVMALVVVVGVARLALSLAGLPVSGVKYFSVTTMACSASCTWA